MKFHATFVPLKILSAKDNDNGSDPDRSYANERLQPRRNKSEIIIAKWKLI